MKTFTLTPTQFYLFCKTALALGILFSYNIKDSVYHVTGDEEEMIETGYFYEQ